MKQEETGEQGIDIVAAYSVRLLLCMVQVWFDDPRSLGIKYQLAADLGLRCVPRVLHFGAFLFAYAGCGLSPNRCVHERPVLKPDCVLMINFL